MADPLAPATSRDELAFGKPEDGGFSRDGLARIGEALERDIAAGTLPGAVTLVARRGRVVHFRAHGARSPDAPDPMALDTIFRIYSMTKPIVSVLGLMLLETGRIRLTDPLPAYIPAFAEMQVARPDGGLEPARRPITLQDLFRHTSGLTYDWLDPGPAGKAYARAGAGDRGLTNEQQAALLATLPLTSHPGEAWCYGRSTDVLGRVIEIVTGLPLGEVLRALLFEPLGMMETGFRVPGDLAHRLAEPLPVDPDSGEPVRLLDVTKPAAMENGGGGLASTASDYGRFLHMLAAGGSLDGRRILSPRTLAWAMSDHLGRIGSASDLLPMGYGFGLGWAVRHAVGVAAFPGSAGDVFWEGLGGTSFWLDPARELYGLIMTQAPGRRERYRVMMRQLVYGALLD